MESSGWSSPILTPNHVPHPDPEHFQFLPEQLIPLPEHSLRGKLVSNPNPCREEVGLPENALLVVTEVPVLNLGLV